MNNKGLSIGVSEGIRLYKQQRSPFWWVALNYEGNANRSSTKVRISDDPEGSGAARDKAIELYAELRVKVQLGVATEKVPTFTFIADKTIEYLDALTPQREVYTSYKRVINKYLKPYFARKPINQVNRLALHQFFEWRKTETKSDISPTQRANTNKAISHIFNYACNHGYIEQYQIPELPRVQVKRTQKGEHFSDDELSKVISGFHDFIKLSRNKKTREIREKLECYVSLLLGTGARPGKEVLNIKYGDISFAKGRKAPVWSVLIRKGKNAHRTGQRKIILFPRALKAVKQLVKLDSDLKGMDLSEVIEKFPDRHVMSVAYRDDVPEFGRPFKTYMEHIGLSHKKFTLYSLRHTFITQQLLAGFDKHMLAKQCGTSEEMINAFYDHVIALDYAGKFTVTDSFNDIGHRTLEEFMK